MGFLAIILYLRRWMTNMLIESIFQQHPKKLMSIKLIGFKHFDKSANKVIDGNEETIQSLQI